MGCRFHLVRLLPSACGLLSVTSLLLFPPSSPPHPGRRSGCDSRPDFLSATCPSSYAYGNYLDSENELDQLGYDPRAFVTDCKTNELVYFEMPNLLSASELGGQECAIGYKALAFFEASEYLTVPAGMGRLWAYSGHRGTASAGWNAVDVCAGSCSPLTFCTRYNPTFPPQVEAMHGISSF